MFCCSVLHSINLTHTDLKPENILLVSSTTVIKISDVRPPSLTRVCLHACVFVRAGRRGHGGHV
jgi:hypothetical protein